LKRVKNLQNGRLTEGAPAVADDPHGHRFKHQHQYDRAANGKRPRQVKPQQHGQKCRRRNSARIAKIIQRNGHLRGSAEWT